MSDNYFAQLQMLSMSANDSVAEARLKLDRIAEIFQNRPEQKEWIQAFAWLRKDFPVEALIQAGASQSTSTILHPSYLRSYNTIHLVSSAIAT